MAGALRELYKIANSHTQPILGRGSLCDAQAIVGTNPTHTPTDWPQAVRTHEVIGTAIYLIF
jgi:hypothetical protein